MDAERRQGADLETEDTIALVDEWIGKLVSTIGVVMLM